VISRQQQDGTQPDYVFGFPRCQNLAKPMAMLTSA
jgi:hypothetical protein